MFKITVFKDGEVAEEVESHNVEFSSDLGEMIEYPTELQEVSFDRVVVESADK